MENEKNLENETQTIMIVDDTPENLQLLSSILRENGYRVRSAVSGKIALKSVKLSKPQLILLDIKMPEMDGYAVCKHLKEDPETSDIPVIFVSALGETIDKVEAFNIGGVDYLTKPIQREELLARVQTHVSLSEAKSELNKRNQELFKINTELEEIVKVRTKELNEKNRRLLFENVLDTIIIIDKDGTVLFANENCSSIFGQEPEKLIGKSVNLFKEKYKEKTELTISLPSGEEKTIIVRGIEIQWKDEAAWQMTLQDITEQKEMEKELRHKDEVMIAQSRQAAMGEMISMIAHQWRQPLASVSMEINNLLVDIELEMCDKEEFGKTLQNMSEQIQHLSETINDFRNFFKSEKEKEETTADKILNNVFQIVGKALENDNIEIKEDLKSQVILHTYPNELLQALINIFNNAREVLKESENNSNIINIETLDEKDKVIFKISDNAGGVPNEILSRIFEPYFSTKEKKGGTGLGLYISKTIIEKHLSGTLEVKNNEEGACFTIILPIK